MFLPERGKAGSSKPGTKFWGLVSFACTAVAVQKSAKGHSVRRQGAWAVDSSSLRLRIGREALASGLRIFALQCSFVLRCSFGLRCSFVLRCSFERRHSFPVRRITVVHWRKATTRRQQSCDGVTQTASTPRAGGGRRHSCPVAAADLTWLTGSATKRSEGYRRLFKLKWPEAGGGMKVDS